VETDASGNEVFHFVNTGPMPAAAIAQFRWHTPSLSPGEVGQHFCLQASLFHPLDVNAANNMGQENTNVWQTTVRAGQEVPLDIPLFNYARRQQRFRFEAYEYAIEEARVELTLKTMRGYRRMSPSTFLASLLPSFHFGFSRALDGGLNRSPFPRLHMRFQPRLVAVKNKYVGLQRIQETMRSRTNRLPQEITITAEGEDLRRGIELQPKTLRTLLFRITVAPTIQPKVLPLTILARSEDGVLAGGVTIVLQIEE
jgi:hypothetical protein